MPNYHRIRLSSGKYAIVSPEDYEVVRAYKWSYHPEGYAYCKDGLMHRMIMKTPEGMETDHRNHRKLDNRRKNLRIVTKSENQYNRKSKGSCKYRGVYLYMGRYYIARIRIDGEQRYLGCYPTAKEAGRAYDLVAMEHIGKNAILNFGVAT